MPTQRRRLGTFGWLTNEQRARWQVIQCLLTPYKRVARVSFIIAIIIFILACKATREFNSAKIWI